MELKAFWIPCLGVVLSMKSSANYSLVRETRICRVVNGKELETVVGNLALEGFRLIDGGNSFALMKKHTWGSLIVHIILFFLSFGIGNIIYALLAHGNAEKVLVRVDSSSKRGDAAISSEQTPEGF
jgi:hypothetical protein